MRERENYGFSLPHRQVTSSLTSMFFFRCKFFFPASCTVPFFHLSLLFCFRFVLSLAARGLRAPPVWPPRQRGSMRLQRRRAAYNIDYAALNEGGGVDGSDGDGDGDDGVESLFKQQDPAALRDATLSSECASAKVKRKSERMNGARREREREDEGAFQKEKRHWPNLHLRPPLSLNNSLFSSPSLETK